MEKFQIDDNPVNEVVPEIDGSTPMSKALEAGELGPTALTLLLTEDNF